MSARLTKIRMMIEVIRLERERGTYLKEDWDWASAQAEEEIRRCESFLQQVEEYDQEAICNQGP